MNFDFVPEGEHLAGSITFKTLSVEERLDASCMLVDDVKGLGTGDTSTTAKTSINILKSSIEMAKNHIIKVNLKNTETNTQYNSYDELNDDETMHGVIVAMSTAYMERVDLGKLIGAQSKTKLPQPTEAIQ